MVSGDNKRRSLTMALSSVFRRNGNNPNKDSHISQTQSYRSVFLSEYFSHSFSVNIKIIVIEVLFIHCVL